MRLKSYFTNHKSLDKDGPQSYCNSLHKENMTMQKESSKKPWKKPALTILAASQTAFEPQGGADGGQQQTQSGQQQIQIQTQQISI